MPHPFEIVDVFAERRYEGNPLAVVFESDDLATAEMQRIAHEMNFSETTFVASSAGANGAWPVRIFTPAEELPFAGHPTLGTASVIRALGGGGAEQVDLALGVGTVPVRFEPESGGEVVAWLRAPSVELGPRVAADEAAAVVGLAPDDVDPALPVRQLTAGPSFVFARVVGQGALRRARLDTERLAALVPAGSSVGIYLFCAETVAPGVDLAARMLFDAGGPREDPATGSATAMLGAHLREHAYPVGEPFSLRIEQGVAMGRPSLLRLTVRERDEGGPEIRVGGRVVPVARGELL
jgi:trans-2,3-dihydro-3-hydroxyanthranilate isomerase